MDQLGPRKVVPLGAATVAIGALLFSTGDPTLGKHRPLHAGRGRRLRADRRGLSRDDLHAGVARRDPDRRDADVRHGRRLGRPVRRRPADRVRASPGTSFWLVMGIIGIPIAVLLFLLIPKREQPRRRSRKRGPGPGAPRDGHGVHQPAVDPLRPDRRPALHPDDHLRHGLGRALPAGGARPALFGRGAALGRGAVRLDHRLPAARLADRPHRPPQAGHHRRRHRPARLRSRSILLRAARDCSRPTAWRCSPASRRARR